MSAAALEARQPDRHRRRQQQAGRRPLDRGAGLRAADAQVRGLRLARRSASTATTSTPWSPPSTRAQADAEPKPRIIICDTKMAKGVPFLEAREKTHFLRVEPDEWQLALDALDAGRPA